MNISKAVIKIELKPKCRQESRLVKAMQVAIAPLTFRDVRDLTGLVRQLITHHGLHMTVGTGGSHIWIHRGNPVTDPKPGDPERWAIITQDPAWQP